MMWAVTLTYQGQPTPDQLMRFEDALADFDGFVAAQPNRGFTAVLHLDDAEMAKAATQAAAIAHPVAPGVPVGLEVVSEERYEQSADEPTMPELVSAPEVAEILDGISRQRVHQLRSTAAFPAPLYELRTGPVWDARAIRHFASHWERKPGRPVSQVS